LLDQIELYKQYQNEIKETEKQRKIEFEAAVIAEKLAAEQAKKLADEKAKKRAALIPQTAELICNDSVKISQLKLSVAESIELAHELDRLNRPDLANILDSFDES